jgi:hypothetical protein
MLRHVARPECRLCSGFIPADELQQHVTGDYHKICMSTVVAADLHVEFLKRPALCSLCCEAISANAVVARPGQLIIHLGCFFGRRDDDRKSLGAAASRPTLTEHSFALRQCSRALQRTARRVKERAHAVRARHAVSGYGFGNDPGRTERALGYRPAGEVGMSDLREALLDDGAWTLTESRRACDVSQRLRGQACALLLTYRAHRFGAISAAPDI